MTTPRRPISIDATEAVTPAAEIHPEDPRYDAAVDHTAGLAAQIELARQFPELPILTAKATASILHVGLKQVRAHLASGGLAATSLGPRTLRIAYSDVLELATAHRTGPARSDVAGHPVQPASMRGKRRVSLFDAPDALTD